MNFYIKTLALPTVQDVDDIHRYLAKVEVGKSLNITVLREGKKLGLSIQAEEAH